MTYKTLSATLLFLCTFAATAASAQTDAELCEKIFKKYRVRSELCEVEEKKPAEQPIPDNVKESSIFFESGTRMTPQSKERMELLSAVLETSIFNNACLSLVGHSDTSGSAESNDRIAMKRAEVVAETLKSRLSSPGRIIEIKSEGESNPIKGISGTSKENRRVEIYAKSCPI